MNKITTRLAAIAASIAIIGSTNLIGPANAQTEEQNTAPQVTAETQPAGLPLTTDVEKERTKNKDKVVIVLVIPNGRCAPCDEQEQLWLDRGKAFDDAAFFKAKISLFHLPRGVVPGVYAFTPGVDHPSYAQPRIDFDAAGFDRFVNARIAFAKKRQNLVSELDNARKDLADKSKIFDEERQAVVDEQKEFLSAESQAVEQARSQMQSLPPFPGVREAAQQRLHEAVAEFNDAAEAAGYTKRFAHINDRMQATLATELARVRTLEDALEKADHEEDQSGNQTDV
jgi:hypothetical protein